MNNAAGPSRSANRPQLVEELYKTASGVPVEWASMFGRIELNNGISIGSMQGRARTEWEVRAKSPPMFCIAVMLDGRLRTALDGGAMLDFRPGMVSLMSTGATTCGWNRFSGHPGFKMVDIRLTPDALCQFTGQTVLPLRGKMLHDCSLPGLDAFMGCTPASTSLMRVANDVLGCRMGSGAARRLYMRAKALEALAIVLDGLASSGGTARPLPVPADRQRLLRAKSLLESGYGQSWTVPALASAVGLNEKRLQSGFQSLFGLSIHAQLTQIRMDAAADMLTKGASVTETAYAVGFSSLSHFSKVFRSIRGMAPKQWALGSHTLEHRPTSPPSAPGAQEPS